MPCDEPVRRDRTGGTSYRLSRGLCKSVCVPWATPRLRDNDFPLSRPSLACDDFVPTTIKTRDYLILKCYFS